MLLLEGFGLNSRTEPLFNTCHHSATINCSQDLRYSEQTPFRTVTSWMISIARDVALGSRAPTYASNGVIESRAHRAVILRAWRRTSRGQYSTALSIRERLISKSRT